MEGLKAVKSEDGSQISDHDERGTSTPPLLHQHIEEKDLEELFVIFKSMKGNNFMREEFAQILAKYQIFYEDEDFENLFLKINTSRDDQVDWDEFISYLIYSYQISDPNNQKAALDLPMPSNPTICLSQHRHPILKIDFCPMVLPDRTMNNYQGSHVTTSVDGQVNYWSLQWEKQRSGKSKNPFLKAATWIVTSISLPDLRLVCVATSERHLRFYDSSANNYVLRLMIHELPTFITQMCFKFYQSILVDGKLITGDDTGQIRIFEIANDIRRCFKIDVTQIAFRDILAGKFPYIKCTEHLNYHVDRIRQLTFYNALNSFISASECTHLSISQQSKVPGVMVVDVVRNYRTLIKVNGGITCFDYDPVSFLFVTGGPDCNIRLWSLSAPQVPSAVLPGHHAGIIFLFIQDQGKKIYSLDKKRICKVWDAPEQSLLQTYIGFVSGLSDSKFLTCFYNDLTRELIVAGSQIAIAKCCPLLRFDMTDGDTHSRAVSIVLYNKLFNVIITCGLDSYIIVWDPWKNKRLNLIQMSHTRELYGEILRMQITAATFDSKHQLLLTGARDGTLKIWNFNNGFCMRNLKIEDQCEVTSVFWVGDRILAVGWNRHVTEFVDTEEENDYSNGKKWDICHAEDILASAARAPQSLVTSSYSGELVFWKFETGQPYRRHKTNMPKERQKIIYQGNKFRIDEESGDSSKKVSTMSSLSKRASVLKRPMANLSASSSMNSTSMVDLRRISAIRMPSTLSIFQQLSVQAMIFLESRPMTEKHGTLFVALSNGKIQVWSHHQFGGYITEFNAIHMAGDSVVALATDDANMYLFTGSALGYIKTWVMKDYCVPNAENIKISKPLMRTIFPFLIRDIFDGRAKRTVRNQRKPWLVNSYKAHAQSITSLIYINKTKILVSGSTDKSVRMWTLNGFYIGTIGSPLPRREISSKKVNEEDLEFRVPPDIRREASFTTLKVLKDGAIHPALVKKPETKQDETEQSKIMGLKKCIYGQPLEEPVMGKHFKLPDRCKPHFKPFLDVSEPHVPIYRHIELTPLVEPGKPPILMPKLRVTKPPSQD